MSRYVNVRTEKCSFVGPVIIEASDFEVEESRLSPKSPVNLKTFFPDRVRLLFLLPVICKQTSMERPIEVC